MLEPDRREALLLGTLRAAHSGGRLRRALGIGERMSILTKGWFRTQGVLAVVWVGVIAAYLIWTDQAIGAIVVVAFALLTWFGRRIVSVVPQRCLNCGFNITPAIRAHQTSCPACGVTFDA